MPTPPRSAADRAFERARTLCLALPEATEKEAWGSPTFRVRGKKMFAMLLDDHHGDGRLALWLKSDLATQDLLVEADPKRFFVPPYTGPSGWVGVRLEGRPSWKQIEGLTEAAYRLVAPKKLIAELDAR